MVSHYRSPAEDSTVLKFKVWGGKGWCSGESACLPPTWPGVEAMCGLSLLLVLSFVPRGFSPGIQVFPSPQKPAFSNSNSIRNWVDEEPLCGCATSKSSLLLLLLLLLLLILLLSVDTGQYIQPDTLPPNQSSIFSSVK